MMMAMEEKKNEEEKDVFSKLTDDLIIHILSFLDTPSATKTCILSKRFTPLLHSLPSLVRCNLASSNLFDFVSHLIHTISERSNNNSSLRKLSLGFEPPSLYLYKDARKEKRFRELMRLAFEKCSGELELSFHDRSYIPPFDPYLSSSSSAPNSLTSMKFTSAKFLRLHGLLSSCPLLRELSLVRCHLETQLRISGTQLRALVLDRCRYIVDWCTPDSYQILHISDVEAEIHIEAKNLETFSYTMADDKESFVFTEYPDTLKNLTLAGDLRRSMFWLEDTIPKLVGLESLSINHDACLPCTSAVKISSRSLKSLELISYSNVTKDSPNWLELLLAECKLLRQLKLIRCTLNENINISHMKLERLDIRDCLGMVKAHIIDTPRLCSFTHIVQPSALKHFNHSSSSLTQSSSAYIKNKEHAETILEQLRSASQNIVTNYFRKKFW